MSRGETIVLPMLRLHAFDLCLEVVGVMEDCIVGFHSFANGWLDDVKIPLLEIGVEDFLVDMGVANFPLQRDIEYRGFNAFYRIQSIL
jgi:hypothetical protein